MKKQHFYTIHLCGGDTHECCDVRVAAASAYDAERAALVAWPLYKGARHVEGISVEYVEAVYPPKENDDAIGE